MPLLQSVSTVLSLAQGCSCNLSRLLSPSKKAHLACAPPLFSLLYKSASPTPPKPFKVSLPGLYSDILTMARRQGHNENFKISENTATPSAI